MFKNLNRGISTPIAIGIIIVLVVVVGGGILAYQYYYIMEKEQTEPPTPAATPTPTIQPTTSIEYRNTQYGFSFSLPISWKEYSIVVDKWEGYPLDVQNAVKVEGPKILIRHPQWTSVNSRQDIPIMIFTITQWNLIQQEKLSVGAAPIRPSELGRNDRYVFALPARYNYAFLTGYEEVEKILQGNPLRAF